MKKWIKFTIKQKLHSKNLVRIC